MGRAYNDQLDNREILQVQLQMWAAACSDEEVRAVARRRMGGLWQRFTRLSGADERRVSPVTGRRGAACGAAGAPARRSATRIRAGALAW
jgi:hypothetical protein